MRSMSCFVRNLATISGPKVKDTPLSFSPHPTTSLSGSDHRRSHSKPGDRQAERTSHSIDLEKSHTHNNHVIIIGLGIA